MSGAHRRSSPHEIPWIAVISHTITSALMTLCFLGVFFGPIYEMSRTDWAEVAALIMILGAAIVLILMGLWDHKSYQNQWDSEAERIGRQWRDDSSS